MSDKMQVDWKNYIISDPNVLDGKPYIKGTNIPVSLVLERLSAEYSPKKIIAEFPNLKKEHIIACLDYAREWEQGKYQDNSFLSSKGFDLLKKEHFTSLVAVFIGFLYLTGYLINSIFLRSIGIESVSLSKIQYIETGSVFLFFTVAFLVVPWYTPRMIGRIKGEKENAWTLGTWVMSIVIIIFYLVLMFFTLHIPNELEPSVEIIWGRWSIGSVFVGYILILMSGVGVIIWIKKKYAGQGSNASDPIPIQLFRFFLLVCSLLFVAILYHEAKRREYDKLVTAARFYIFISITFGFSLFMLINKINTIQINRHKYKLLLYSLFFLVPLFYLIIVAYSSSVYRILPINRGGRLPVTSATISFKNNIKFFKTEWPPLIDIDTHIDTNTCTIGPVFIIEQNEEDICFLLDKYPAFGSPKFKKVYAIKKADLYSITYERFDARDFWLKEKSKKKCPICGKAINSKDTPVKVEHNKENIALCSENCADTFKKDPGKYEKENTQLKGK